MLSVLTTHKIKRNKEKVKRKLWELRDMFMAYIVVMLS